MHANANTVQSKNMTTHRQEYNDDPWHSKYWLQINPETHLEARDAPWRRRVASAEVV